jgi:hypothetical protein
VPRAALLTGGQRRYAEGLWEILRDLEWRRGEVVVRRARSVDRVKAGAAALVRVSWKDSSGRVICVIPTVGFDREGQCAPLDLKMFYSYLFFICKKEEEV